MTTPRRACPPAPGPLEDYCRAFDPLLPTFAQRNSFRRYLEGLLLPRERNKTLTALASAEPIVGAQGAAVQRLQFFLSESDWDPVPVNERRLELLIGAPETRPHAGGVLILDETGDRKWGSKTAHVGRQYLGSRGKVESGIVAVTSLWADERLYYPLDVEPYTPAALLAGGKADPTFRTKPQLALELVLRAQGVGVPFRAVVADCLYGANEALVSELFRRRIPFVLAIRGAEGVWAPAEALHTAEEAARALGWRNMKRPGRWKKIVRHFRDGHEETWWAGELAFAHLGPDGPRRAVAVTTDPATLPEFSTWYVVTNLPSPGRGWDEARPFAPAALEEVVRLYGLRVWVEEGYKQVKHELGWADFMVRSDRAIRRHWQLVLCAFSFCWRAYLPHAETPAVRESSEAGDVSPPGAEPSGRGKNPGPARVVVAAAPATPAILAPGAPAGAQLALPLARAPALVARLVAAAPAGAIAGAA